MFVIALIWTVLFLCMVWQPMRQALEERRQMQLVKAYKAFQLQILRSRYPALTYMSDREIYEKFQVDRIYNHL